MRRKEFSGSLHSLLRTTAHRAQNCDAESLHSDDCSKQSTILVGQISQQLIPGYLSFRAMHVTA